MKGWPHVNLRSVALMASVLMSTVAHAQSRWAELLHSERSIVCVWMSPQGELFAGGDGFIARLQGQSWIYEFDGTIEGERAVVVDIAARPDRPTTYVAVTGRGRVLERRGDQWISATLACRPRCGGPRRPLVHLASVSGRLYAFGPSLILTPSDSAAGTWTQVTGRAGTTLSDRYGLGGVRIPSAICARGRGVVRRTSTGQDLLRCGPLFFIRGVDSEEWEPYGSLALGDHSASGVDDDGTLWVWLRGGGYALLRGDGSEPRLCRSDLGEVVDVHFAHGAVFVSNRFGLFRAMRGDVLTDCSSSQ